MNDQKPPPSRLDDARRLARQALNEARADEDPGNHSFLLGRLEVALKSLLDTLDAEDGAK